MSPESQQKAKDLKQKITLGVTVVIILFVAWQVYKMFGSGGGGGTPEPTQPKTMAQTGGGHPAGQGGAPAAAPAPAPAPESDQPRQVPVVANADLLKLQQDTQAKYIAALNELEMLKIQREIAVTKQAITSATLATATTEKSITDLLTVQSGSSSAGGGNPYSPFATTSTGLAPGEQAPPGAMQVPKQQPLIQPVSVYTLMSVAYKGEKWSAVIQYQKVLYDVSVGDILPADGSVVTSIDRNGVTIMKDKVTKRLTLMTSL